jgi:D-beta-D-heptose 7-phosphate kinase/D-beta-D-heptose 1-phosphate adenosyltransferase
VILVIGDSCIDKYLYGYCNRLAPEAPVPVFMNLREEVNGGMARNVYDNILSLDKKCDIITNPEDITKTRFVEHRTNHIILRVDSNERKVNRIENIESIPFEKYSAIVISDYDHGFLTEGDIKYICSRAKGTTFLDTKKKLGEWCHGIDFIKINQFEYEETKKSVTPEIKENLIVTLSDKGCVYLDDEYGVESVDVKDMTGAGDTFLSGLVSEYIDTKDIKKSIQTANEYATIIVQQKGVKVIGDYL